MIITNAQSYTLFNILIFAWHAYEYRGNSFGWAALAEAPIREC